VFQNITNGISGSFYSFTKKGLAYRKNAPVNWCPSCQTVLAREQVLNDGTCERCGTTVEQKILLNGFLRLPIMPKNFLIV